MAERRICWETDVVCDKNLCTGCSGKLKILLIINEESDGVRQKLEDSQTFITCPSCGMMASGKLVLDHINTGTPMSSLIIVTTEENNYIPHILNCTKSFDPIAFIGQGWKTWKGPATGDGLCGEEDIDSRSLALVSLDPAKLIFETCLEGVIITGEEKLRKLKKKTDLVRLGGNVFLSLWENYQQNKENSVLEWLYRNKKIIYLDFFGLVLRDLSGHRYVLHLSRPRRGDGRWGWHHRWLGHDWDASRFSVCGCANLSAEVMPTE